MADSDDDRSDAGSFGDGGFDPTQNLDKMTEKERKKWDKNCETWRIFMDFIFRHISIVTFKYNCFEREELMQLLIALDKGEGLREQTKLKKSESPQINSFKVMRECADLLVQHRYVNEANRIKRFLDIMGRMKGIGMIAGGFLKALKKGKVKGMDKLKDHMEYWKGFCSRTFDFRDLQFRNANPDVFNELEQRFLIWPTVVRTSINLSQKFLKQASKSSGLELLSADQKTMQKHMQAAEFVLAAKLEENLFNRVVQESKAFLRNPLITGNTASPVLDNESSKWSMPDLNDVDPTLLRPISDDGANPQNTGKHIMTMASLGVGGPPSHSQGPMRWDLPDVTIDSELLEPISDDGLLVELPAEPPKDKKGRKGKGKKGAKGSAKGKKKKKK